MLYLTYVTVPLINCAMALHNLRKFASKMSDEFSQCCSRFKDAIRFTQPELRYEAREKEKRVLFTLEIPYPLLSEWHKIVQERNVLSRGTSVMICQADVKRNRQILLLQVQQKTHLRQKGSATQIWWKSAHSGNALPLAMMKIYELELKNAC